MPILPYYHVDAFSDRTFSGNPAGVCLLEEALPETTFQAIASENNLSETAFVLREGGVFVLRWFTPVTEVDLCGHATLAAAHVLFHHLDYDQPEICFQSRSGILKARKKGPLIVLDFPSQPAVPCEPPDNLIQGLGLRPVFTAKSCDYMAVLEDEAAVRGLKPDWIHLNQLDCRGIIATAKGKECDFVSRFFAPRAGIPEDPATGSAHCTLAPYWSEILGKTELHARQISPRGGTLLCKILGSRVLLAGQAVTYATGHLHLQT